MLKLNMLFRFMIHALLCLSILNIASWRIAWSIHEIHDHLPCHSQLSDASGSLYKSGDHDTHGACHICKLFSQHKPEGTTRQIPPPAPVFIASSLIPVISIQAPTPFEQGYHIRAPPLS